MPVKCGSLDADSRESSRPANYAASWMQARELAFLLIEPLALAALRFPCQIRLSRLAPAAHFEQSECHWALAALSSTAIETWSRLAPAVQARTKSLLVNRHPSS